MFDWGWECFEYGFRDKKKRDIRESLNIEKEEKTNVKGHPGGRRDQPLQRMTTCQTLALGTQWWGTENGL